MRRFRRTAALLLPAGVLASGLATSAHATAAPPLPVAGTAPLAATSLLRAPVAGTSAVPSPDWTFPREAFLVLLLSYVGFGAIAAAGIWSYLRRRW